MSRRTAPTRLLAAARPARRWSGCWRPVAVAARAPVRAGAALADDPPAAARRGHPLDPGLEQALHRRAAAHRAAARRPADQSIAAPAAQPRRGRGRRRRARARSGRSPSLGATRRRGRRRAGTAPRWSVSCAGRCRPGSASTVRYYVAAAALLPVGALLGTLLARGLGDPAARTADRRARHGQRARLDGPDGRRHPGHPVADHAAHPDRRRGGAAARRALPVLVAAVARRGRAARWPARCRWSRSAWLGYLGRARARRPPLRRWPARRRPPASYPTWSVLAGAALAGRHRRRRSRSASRPRPRGTSPTTVCSCADPGAGGGLRRPGAARRAVLPGPGRPRRRPDAGPRGQRRPRPRRRRCGSCSSTPGCWSACCRCRRSCGCSPRRWCSAGSPRSCRCCSWPCGPPVARRRRRHRAARPRAGTGPAGAGRAARYAGLAATGLAAVGARRRGRASRSTRRRSARPGRRAASAGVVPTGQTTHVAVEAREHAVHARRRSRCRPATGWSSTLTNTDPTGTSTTWCSTPAPTAAGSRRGESAHGGASAWSAATSRAGARCSGTGRWAWCCTTSQRRRRGRQSQLTRPWTARRRPQRADASSPERRGADLDFMAAPPPGFVAHDATLPPCTGGRVHRRTLTVREVEQAGRTRRHPDACGPTTAPRPGPVLHGRVGDSFEITLVNDATIGHSIDFHAGALAPDGADADDRARGVAGLQVHRDPRRRLDVPLLDHADVRPHRQRPVRRRRHRAAAACRASTAATCSCSPSSTSARRAAGRHRQAACGATRCGGVQRLRQPVRPPAAHRPGRRAGPHLGARRRPQPRQLVPRRRRPVRHRLLRGGLPAAPRRPRGGSQALALAPRRAASSSSSSRKPGTTRSSPT